MPLQEKFDALPDAPSNSSKRGKIEAFVCLRAETNPDAIESYIDTTAGTITAVHKSWGRLAKPVDVDDKPQNGKKVKDVNGDVFDTIPATYEPEAKVILQDLDDDFAKENFFDENPEFVFIVKQDLHNKGFAEVGDKLVYFIAPKCKVQEGNKFSMGGQDEETMEKVFDILSVPGMKKGYKRFVVTKTL